MSGWKRLYYMPILVLNRVWFLRELGEFMDVFVVLIPKDKARKSNMRIRIMEFKKSFCWRSNLSNNDIISTYVVLKTGIDFIDQVWKRVWKMTFWSEIGSGWHTPTKNFEDYPPREKQYVFSLLISPWNQRWNANPRTKGMNWVALPFVVLYRRIKLHYFGIFITCVQGRLFHLFCKKYL